MIWAFMRVKKKGCDHEPPHHAILRIEAIAAVEDLDEESCRVHMEGGASFELALSAVHLLGQCRNALRDATGREILVPPMSGGPIAKGA